MNTTVALIAPTGQTTLGELIVPNWLTKDEWLTTHPEKAPILDVMELVGVAPQSFALVKTTLTSGVEEYYEAYHYGHATPEDGEHAGERLDLFAVVDRTPEPQVEIPDYLDS